ncbi:hypothetical protein BGX24_003825, partial [Mortierella sp. AD032]
YHQDADQGLAYVQFSVGVLYEGGRDMAQSHSKALELYLKAADQGFAIAQIYVAVFHEHGRESYLKEMVSFLKVARQGYYDIQFGVGEVKTERSELRSHSVLPKRYLKAAEQGHTLSQQSSPPWNNTPRSIHGLEVVPLKQPIKIYQGRNLWLRLSTIAENSLSWTTPRRNTGIARLPSRTIPSLVF